VKLRVKFEKEILPALMQNLQSAAAALKGIFGALTGSLNGVLAAFGKLAELVVGSVLSIIQSALQWVTDKLTELAELITGKLMELGDWLQGIFDKLRAFVTIIIQFLEKVSAVANKIMDLPLLILGGLWKLIPSCIRVPVENFLINVVLKKIPFFEDVVALVGVWQKIKKGAMNIIKTVFITGDLKGGILQAFKLFLDVLNIPVQLVIGIYEKARSAFDKIVNKPRVIFSSIVSAVKAGFTNFHKNFLKNSLDAVGNWIFSKVKGVKMPKEFTIKSIFGLVLDIVGITEENIFKRIEKKTNKAFADKLKAVYTTLKGAAAWVVQILQDPKAAYEKAKQNLKNLKAKLFESIGAWIAESVIGKFIAQMIAMMASTPFGQAIEAIIDTYKMIKTGIEYAEKVLRVVDSVLDSILDLAAGVITKAVSTVEKGLTIGLEVAVAFIAKVISIGDLPEQVKKIVEEDIRPIVNSAIDAVIDGVIEVVKTLKEFFGFGDKGKEKEPQYPPEKQAKIDAGIVTMKEEKKKYLKDGKIVKADADKVASTVKANHPVFSSFIAEDIGEKIQFAFTASAKTVVDTVDDADAGVLPAQRFLPVSKRSTWIRYNLHASESEWKRQSNRLRTAEMPFIEMKVQNEINNLPSDADRLAAWKQLGESGYVPRNEGLSSYLTAENKIDLAKLRSIEYQADHIVDIAIKWNSEGNNSDDDFRKTYALDFENIRTVTKEWNLTKPRVQYVSYVGPGFKSEKVSDGGKKIDGEPFLDDKMKPLI
jgi:hypothetical protein